MTFDDLNDPRYVALETFRKNGQGVITPIWAIEREGKLYMGTDGDSGKVKRIRNNKRVRICESDSRGNPKSDWIDAEARILDSSEDEERIRKALSAKYGWQYHFFNILSKVTQRGGIGVALEISEPEG